MRAIDLLARTRRVVHERLAMIEPGVIGTISACNGNWCEMTFDGHTGWISQSLVWGAYPGELVKD